MIRVLIATLPLAACATTPKAAPQPIVVPQEVVVAGPAGSCVPKTVGPAPVYPDTDATLKAAKTAADRYLLLAAGRPLRDARLSELETVVESCRK